MKELKIKNGGWRLLKPGELIRESDEFNGIDGWTNIGDAEKLIPFNERIKNDRYRLLTDKNGHWPIRRWDNRLKS
jgi:hypothetical protein